MESLFTQLSDTRRQTMSLKSSELLSKSMSAKETSSNSERSYSSSRTRRSSPSKVVVAKVAILEEVQSLAMAEIWFGTLTTGTTSLTVAREFVFTKITSTRLTLSQPMMPRRTTTITWMRAAIAGSNDGDSQTSSLESSQKSSKSYLIFLSFLTLPRVKFWQKSKRSKKRMQSRKRKMT